MTRKARRMLRLMDRATALWHFPVLGRDKGGLVRRLVTRHRPRAAVEVGSLFGYSAILIAGALPRGGRLTCVEANEYLAEIVEANVAEAGLGSRVRVLRGDGRRVLATLRGRVDFALIASGPIPVAARRPRLAAALNGCGTRLGPPLACVLGRLGSRPGGALRARVLARFGPRPGGSLLARVLGRLARRGGPVTRAARWLGVLAVAVALAALALPAGAAPARPLAVAGVFQTPLEEPWVRVIHEALLRARRELGVRYDWAAAVAPDRFEGVLRERAAGRYGLVVGDAFGQEEALRRVARAAPGVRFLFGSGLGPSPPNLGVFDNWLHEPAYLCGLLAGKLTRSRVVGVVGARPVPEVNRLVNAFAAGAREADPGVRVAVAFIDSWYDPARAREAALRQIDAGADVLYAERAGVIEAARDRGVLAFGNLVDQRAVAPDTVVTGPVWDLFPLVRLAIAAVRRGTFEPLDYGQWTMLQRGGAGLAPLGPWAARLPREALELVRTREQAIRAGLFRVAIDESSPRGE